LFHVKIPKKWMPILQEAAEIVRSYSTLVTLRQLYYRLVALGRIENLPARYKDLSASSAIARREGWFPDLLDRTRSIHVDRGFSGPKEARSWLRRVYRRDRTEGQPNAVYLGVEKDGIVEQLKAWFGEYGIPILSLRGFASQTYVKEVRLHVVEDGRPAVLLYAGDWDPSGEEIDRDFETRVDAFTKVIRVALTAEQVDAYHLPPNPGKTGDSRAPGFVARHGALLQVELDALAPDDLRKLYMEQVNRFWDAAAFESVMERELTERAELGGAR